MSEYRYQSIANEQRPVSGIYRANAPEALISNERTLVLMVGMHLSKTRGGITTLTADILNSELDREYDFRYVASQAEDFGIHRKLLQALTAVIRFLWISLFERPKLVYVHIGSNASLYRESVFVLLAKLMGRPVVAHFHAGDIDNYFPRQSELGKRYIRFAVGLSDTIIAVSTESARQLSQLNAGLNISIIPNAIDTAAFDDCMRPSVKPNGDEPVRLLFVGAIGKLKGEKDLIDALVIIRKKGFNVKASFLGYGAENLAAYCRKRRVADLLDHLGPVPMEERISFYQQADIFVLPTYAEAMPISVIEAMAAGLPVVSTPVGGIPELIHDGEEGLLCPSGDVNALAEKIMCLVSDHQRRTEMGTKGRKRVREQMDFTAYVGRLRAELIRLTEPDSTI